MTPASLVSSRAPWQAGCDDAVCSVCTTQVFCGDSVLWHCPAHGLPVGWALSHPPLESLAALEAARAACQQGPGAPSVPVVQDDDNSSDERLMADFDTMQGPDAAVGPTEGDHADSDGGGDEADNEEEEEGERKKARERVREGVRAGGAMDAHGCPVGPPRDFYENLCRQVFYRLS